MKQILLVLVRKPAYFIDNRWMACYENESFQRFELIAHLHGWVATIIDAFVDFENYLDEDFVLMERN